MNGNDKCKLIDEKKKRIFRTRREQPEKGSFAGTDNKYLLKGCNIRCGYTVPKKGRGEYLRPPRAANQIYDNFTGVA